MSAVLLDAYAVIATLKGEPSADEVRPLLANGEATIHPLNLAEVIDKLCRLVGADPDEVEADVAILGIEHVEVDDAVLVDAGSLRARRYHRIDRPVSLADCVACLHALRAGMALATSDAPLAEMMREEGGVVVPLPNSVGKRPQ